MAGVIPASDTSPLWSADLPHHGTLCTEHDQGCLVVTGDSATLVGRDGPLRWTRQLGHHGDWYPLTRDGLMHRIEADRVVTRDLATGEPLASFDGGPKAHMLRWDPWGGFVFRRLTPDGRREVHSVTLEGEIRWIVPLPDRMSAYRYDVVGDFVVFDVDARLRAYDREGRLRWAAWARSGVPLDQPADEHDRVKDLRRYDDGHLLARYEWYDGGGYFLIDTSGDSREFITTRQVREPLEVLPGVAGGPTRLAMRGPHREEQGTYTYSIWMIDGGQLDWTHEMNAAPVTLSAGADGTLIVSTAPDERRWETYHWIMPLWHQNYVRCLNPDGSVRWTWYAPARITQHPNVGPDGTVYVGTTDRLYALPAHAA